MEKKETLLQDVVIKFAGDSGDGMQLTGQQFTNNTALLGIDLATFPDFPAEIRAPIGTLPGVSGFQLRFSSDRVFTPGDDCDVLVAMNAAALKVNLKAIKKGGKIIANVEVREVYKFDKATVAGCFVLDGKISRNSKIRIIRDGIVEYPKGEGQAAELGSLKRFKDDAKEVASNMECGLTIKNFSDLKVGDIVEAFEEEEVKLKANSISIEPYANLTIEELQLSVRSYNCLKKAQINTVGDLLQYSPEKLQELKNFGRKSADEVFLVLKNKLGLIFK